MWNDFFLDAAINLEGEIFLIEPVATLLTGVRFKTSLPDTFADVMLRLYTTVRMAPQATGFCRSGRIDLLLAQKYELLQSNSRLLGCERIMETRASFILAGFTLSLPRSAPCGTEQTTIDTGYEPALPSNCVDHPADCNLFKTTTLFALIRPSTLNHDRNL